MKLVRRALMMMMTFESLNHKVFSQNFQAKMRANIISNDALDDCRCCSHKKIPNAILSERKKKFIDQSFHKF
jgi:hypothetical protein